MRTNERRQLCSFEENLNRKKLITLKKIQHSQEDDNENRQKKICLNGLSNINVMFVNLVEIDMNLDVIELWNGIKLMINILQASIFL